MEGMSQVLLVTSDGFKGGGIGVMPPPDLKFSRKFYTLHYSVFKLIIIRLLENSMYLLMLTEIIK